MNGARFVTSCRLDYLLTHLQSGEEQQLHGMRNAASRFLAELLRFVDAVRPTITATAAREALLARVHELVADEKRRGKPPTYVQVKRELIAEFGDGVFAAAKDQVRARLKAAKLGEGPADSPQPGALKADLARATAPTEESFRRYVVATKEA